MLRVNKREPHQAAEGAPVVGDEAGADDVAAAVGSARHQRYLQQAAQLVQVLHRRLRVHLGVGAMETLSIQHRYDQTFRLFCSSRSSTDVCGCTCAPPHHMSDKCHARLEMSS